MDGGRAIVRIVTRHQAAAKPHGITCTSLYTIDSDGIVDVVNTVVMDHQLPAVARVGMRVGLMSAFETLSWFGRGPHESYPDRKASALVGRYQSTVNAQFFPFVDPCECGGHEDTRHLWLTDTAGNGLQVSSDQRFHFSALHYTQEDLLQAGHVYELSPTGDVQLCVDGYHMGLGGDTGWSLNVHPEYLLPAGTYCYGFRLSCVTGVD